MKKLLLGLTLLASMSSFAGSYSKTADSIYYRHYNAGDLTEMKVSLDNETGTCAKSTLVYDNGDRVDRKSEVADSRCDKLQAAQRKIEQGVVCEAKTIKTIKDSYRSGKRQVITITLNDDCTCTRNSLYHNAGKNIKVKNILSDESCI